MNKYEKRVEELAPFYTEGEGRGPQTLSEETINQLEQTIGYSLPSDYKVFLADFGGVAFYKYAIFAIQGTSKPDSGSILSTFYGVLPNYPLEDIATLYTDYKGRIPSDLLPIGEDPGGNIICLGLAGEMRGKVYFWGHHGEVVPDKGCEPGSTNVFFVANSFEEFLYSLKPDA
jgi:hypothetical protein